MTNNLLCPKCKGYLSVGENVVFSTEKKDGGKGLILLHQELGNYKVDNHPRYDYEDGERVNFFCPICHGKLASENENLAHVLMEKEDQVICGIYFSQVFGERSTYEIHEDEKSGKAYGEHQGRYSNYFESKYYAGFFK
ncbi:MAG: hypothetical protein GY757_46685 [bacterium]|nr:hypothetical protein [bacterium]